MRDAIARWTHGEPWRTWVAHAVIALVVFTLALPLGVHTAAAVAVGFYFLRECDQILYRIVDKKPLDLFDHLMDVAVPAVAVAAVALTVTAL